MTQKIVNVSEIEELQRFNIDHKGLPFIEKDGSWISFNDLLALLNNAPSVSGEAVGWQFFAYGKWHTGNDKNNHKQSTLGAGYTIRELYTTPQPDRVALLEAINQTLSKNIENLCIDINNYELKISQMEANLKVAVDTLEYWRNECSGNEPSISVFQMKVDEALAKIEE